MPATIYRPILDVPVKGTVPRKTIRKAVQTLAALKKSRPAEYKALLKSASGKSVRVVEK